MATQHPELEAALARWLTDAVEVLESDAAHCVEESRAPKWKIDQDRKLRFRGRKYRAWSREATDKAMALPSAESAREVMKGIPAIASQLGQVVGTQGGGGIALQTDTPLHFLLPGPGAVEYFRSNPEYFAEKYDRLERFLLSDSAFSEVHVWVLSGVRFDSVPVALSEGVHLDQLTDSELAQACEFDLISQIISRDIAWPEDYYDSVRTCIRFIRPAPRAVGNTPTEDLTSRGEEIADLQDRIAQMLALAGLYEVIPTAHMSWTSGQLHGSSWSYARLNATQHLSFPTSASDAEILTLQRAWGLLTEVSPSERGKALDLAVRRMSYLTDRTRTEDRILDLMIAAEAFYLAELGNEPYRGELRYRLALRAGVLTVLQGGSPSDARTNFDLLKDAYDVRSTVAHGGDIAKFLAKKKVTAEEFLKTVVDTLRFAILGALLSISKGELTKWPPNWDDSLFGLFEPPADI